MAALQIITQTDNRRAGGDLDAVAMLYDVYYWFCGVMTGRRVMVDGNKRSRRPIFWQTEPASGHKACILPLKYTISL